MNIAIIPARSGSKRLLNKNIKNFNGKPIISYVIKIAQDAKIFDKILVSTDSKKIKKIAEKYGAEVPYLRAKSLSNDKIHFNYSIKHMIKWHLKKKQKIKNICCIFPTSPLLEKHYLIDGLRKLKKTKNFVFSACSYRSPPQRGFFFKKKKLILADVKSYYKRSQSLKNFYHDAGQFYWGTSENWINENILFNNYSSIIEIPYLNFIDINYKEDWKIAEQLYNLKLRK